MVAAVVVVLTGPSISDLDPDSPEGVVQRYLQASIDGDEDLMRELAVVEDDCTPLPPDFRADDETFRATLGTVDVDGDDADVEVTITRSGGGALDRYEWSETVEFDLVLVDGRWLVESAPWPYRVCEEMIRP